MKAKVQALAVLLLFPSIGSAQNHISLLRYDDDFSAVKNDTATAGFKLKHISLGSDNYISFGGELREQFQYHENINFGDLPPSYRDPSAAQLMHRLLLHSNLEFGSHIRSFVQFNNTLRFINKNPLAPEIDENQLSVHQAFAEYRNSGWQFRLGRQEMYYGKHRLITVREGPNTRQAFDGLLVRKKMKNGSLDLFTVSKVISNHGIFDDESLSEGLYGLYGTQLFSGTKIGVDYYFAQFQSASRKYNYESGFENRSTIGFRLFTGLKAFNFEFEGAYQFGSYDNLTIDAYSVSVDMNAVISSKKAMIGLSANLASGDRNQKDQQLNTYNLLYAKPAYGLVVPVGATNMMSLSPYLKINPLKKFQMLAQLFFLARNSTEDGTYTPGMIQNRPRPDHLFASDETTLGELYVLETNYQLLESLSLAFDASFFKAGSYAESTGNGNDITYFSLRSNYKF